MNLVSRLGFSASLAAAATLVGCVDEQEEPPAYYAPNQAPPPRRAAPPPSIPTTRLPYYEYRSAGDYGTPRPRSPYTIDLGYIGDWQFGSADAPSTPPPSWTRPFPCRWEHSCGMQRESADFGFTRYGYPYPYR